MNIFIYLKHFPPFADDLNEGTRKAVHGLASGLTNLGTSATILCEGLRDNVFYSKYGYHIRCFYNPKCQVKDTVANSASFTIAPSLELYLKTLQRSDLVILNGIFHRSIYSISRLLRKYSIPYIVAPHDPYHPTIFKKNTHLKLPYWHLFEKRLLQQALAVQVLDKRHEEWLQKLNLKTQVFEVSNGFSPGDVRPDSALRWSMHGSANLFFLGRLDAYNKGLDLLLKAFAQVALSSDVKLSIQGPDWGDRIALETQVIKLGLAEKVTFLKPDYNRSPSDIIADYDIFCVPSRFEGFSLSALEAMLAGRVVLISEIAGLAPHVAASQCGVLVQPNIASITSGIEEILKRRSEWKEMGLRGRNYVLQNLHWNNIAATALKGYQHLMAQHSL
jgi:glycosyltransferase involved in cell wall biosynthesis